MIFKKSVFLFLGILLLLSVSCASASTVRKDYYYEFIHSTKLQYLNYDDLEYFFHYTSGLDTVGISYFVFTFDDRPDDFFNQFTLSNFSEKYIFQKEKNDSLEEATMEKILLLIGEKYNEIDERYKLDFNFDYIYNEYPMFYFDSINSLYIIQFLT